MDKPDRNEMKKLCKRSGLFLKNKEIGKLQKDLQELSDYLKKLEDIEVSEEVDPSGEDYWMHRNKSRLREDEVEIFDERSRLIENFPKKDQNYLTVPNVVK